MPGPVCATTPALCPTYPNVFTTIPSGATLAPINLYLFDKNYKEPFTHQARLQYELEIAKGTTISVQYTMFKGVNLSRTRNANLTAPVSTTILAFDAGATTATGFLSVPRFTGTGYAGPRVAGWPCSGAVP